MFVECSFLAQLEGKHVCIPMVLHGQAQNSPCIRFAAAQEKKKKVKKKDAEGKKTQRTSL